MQHTKLFVDARNNLILLLFAKAETKGPSIHRVDIKKLVVLVVLIFFMNTLCMNNLLIF